MKENHKFLTVAKSAVNDIKIKANRHNASSKSCPVFQKEKTVLEGILVI